MSVLPKTDFESSVSGPKRREWYLPSVPVAADSVIGMFAVVTLSQALFSGSIELMILGI